MPISRIVALLAAFFCASLTASVEGQTAADSAAIRATALDYIEGWYANNAARMEQALHPKLAKRMVWTDSTGQSRLVDLTASELVRGTRTHPPVPPSEWRKEVRILSLFGNAAVVRIDAFEWVDYLQQIKWNGRWKIINVVWENRPDLTGLWAATVRYGPGIHGPVIILRNNNSWLADIAGFRIPMSFSGRELSFRLPDERGDFRGALKGQDIVGHWIGELNRTSGRRYATPLLLEPDGPNRWRGEVVPLHDAFTFYLPVSRQADGSYATYLRNPERNQGRFIPVSRIELQDGIVTLLGRTGRAEVLAEGRYDDGVFRVPLRGSSFDFTRVDDESWSPFYPRGKSAQRYRYIPPLQLDDGWPVATVDEVGISRAGIERFVQMLIDMPMDSLSTSQIHSLLIARNGKLVVEEYFHGHHRDLPHDTRSASKSWTAVLLGAAVQAGVPIRLNTPVYRTMLDSLPADLDPRKRAMTLEHLISMTAGYECAGDSAPGNEDVMQSQTKEPDWYRYTLNVPMLTAPGDTIVYCSIEPHLAGGMLRRVAGEPLPELFHRLVAAPLGMKNYHLMLTPTGEAYGGGGHHFVPRDFLKLAQLMLNEGNWKGRQIISRDWARRSGSALRNLNRVQQYGWLWNSLEYSYQGRKVRGFFAGGNGGQIFMGIPELKLAIGFTGGNYNDPALYVPQRVFVPELILPAIR